MFFRSSFFTQNIHKFATQPSGNKLGRWKVIRCFLCVEECFGQFHDRVLVKHVHNRVLVKHDRVFIQFASKTSLMKYVVIFGHFSDFVGETRSCFCYKTLDAFSRPTKPRSTNTIMFFEEARSCFIFFSQIDRNSSIKAASNHSQHQSSVSNSN